MRQSIDTTTVDNANAIDATVDMVYDSLSRVLEDSQDYNSNTRNATNNAFTSYPVTQFTYPQGRQIDNTYDSLYRRTLVEETTGGADIAAWEFFGPSRVAEVQLQNGLICTHMNNARTHSAVQLPGVSNPSWGDIDSDRLGYDGAGRCITKRYLAGGIDGETGAYDDPTSIVGFTTAFDKSSNKFYERALHAESRSSLYQPRDKTTGAVSALGYDSIDRLRQYQRGILNDDTGGDTGGSEVTTPISLPSTDEQRDYLLDGLGNWRTTTYTPVAGSLTTERRDHNHLNQITATKTDSNPKVPFTYDGATGGSNGNLANDGQRSYTYDALNRLTEVFKDPNGTPTLIGTYTYDALGRRIRKVVSNGGLSGDIANGTTDFINIGWRCVEERDGSNAPQRQYVWGIYIDELIEMRDDVAVSPVNRYMLSDLLYRGTALTDSTGAIAEAYDTDAYGNTLIFDAAGTGGDWWADDASTTNEPTCQFIFTGRRFDPETQLYYFRRRNYDPAIGRFLCKDPMDYTIRLNLYEYVISRPTGLIDPTGLTPPSNGDASVDRAALSLINELRHYRSHEWHIVGQTRHGIPPDRWNIKNDNIDERYGPCNKDTTPKRRPSAMAVKNIRHKIRGPSKNQLSNPAAFADDLNAVFSGINHDVFADYISVTWVCECVDGKWYWNVDHSTAKDVKNGLLFTRSLRLKGRDVTPPNRDRSGPGWTDKVRELYDTAYHTVNYYVATTLGREIDNAISMIQELDPGPAAAPLRGYFRDPRVEVPLTGIDLGRGLIKGLGDSFHDWNECQIRRSGEYLGK